MLKDIVYSTSIQKILCFLLSSPNEKYFDREISRFSGVSKAATNFALRDLMRAKLVTREKRGRMYFYQADTNNPLIRQLKITQNVINVHPLTDKLKSISLKIVLYGSSAKGENLKDSDIDLFILSREPQKAKDLIYKSPLREKLQYVVNTPQQLAKLKKSNPVFLKEILRGITLYEEK